MIRSRQQGVGGRSVGPDVVRGTGRGSSDRMPRRPRRQFRPANATVVFLSVAVIIVAAASHGSGRSATTSATVNPTVTPTTASTTSPFHDLSPGPPTDQWTMSLLTTIGGPISPKSVDASDAGRVVAGHPVPEDHVLGEHEAGTLVATISDTVNLGALGVPGGGTVEKAPVEAAFTADAR
jgi:hypothetical protein